MGPPSSSAGLSGQRWFARRTLSGHDPLPARRFALWRAQWLEALGWFVVAVLPAWCSGRAWLGTLSPGASLIARARYVTAQKPSCSLLADAHGLLTLSLLTQNFSVEAFQW